MRVGYSLLFAFGCMVVVGCGGGGGGADGDAMVAPADASLVDAGNSDGGGQDGPVPDAVIPMSITAIAPAAASRDLTTDLTVYGYNLHDGATLVLENCDTSTSYELSSTVVVATDGTSLAAQLVADSSLEQGVYTVTVTNPGGMSDRLVCAFRILASAPPTVTDVVPATAFRGIVGDGISSDATITIVGTGFQSTPAVRWRKSDGTAEYDALFVGFVSETEISAIVPSETLAMAAGDYLVVVTNPDLLAATWMVGVGGDAQPGVFTITETVPPSITEVAPSRIETGSCGAPLTIFGANFDPDATAWYLAESGASCTGSTVDANGNTLCPITVTAVAGSGAEMTAQFDTDSPCPGLGAYPVAVMNPDGQLAYYFSIEITPSSDGHLNTGAFEVFDNELQTPRWRHASVYGFDAFGNAHLYSVGGQDDNGTVLGTAEFSQLTVFGVPGPFRTATQFGDADEPRVVNSLVEPRQGATLVRVGRELYSIGGAPSATDVVATIAGSSMVERARILSYAEMPAVELPHSVGGAGLPHGTWYYQVSAIGPWGESLATREVAALNTGGQLQLCWNAPTAGGASSYNIYRSVASDGRAGTTSLLAVQTSGPCFTDVATGAHTPAPGRLRGVLTTGASLGAGEYLYRVSANTLAGGQPLETLAGYPVTVQVTAADVTANTAAVTLTWDALGDLTYNLYKWNNTASAYRLVDTGGPLAEPTFTDDGAAFDSSDREPPAPIRPLPPGSLSTWDAVSVPALNAAREGLDGVAVQLDPETSGGLVARILVAGGRSDNSGAGGTYLTSAESLGIYEDGTVEAGWFQELPQLVNPRVYFALLSSQQRGETEFPPPPEEPPCGDLDGDGYVDCDCAPPGSPAGSLDCNDADPSVHPGAVEICGDGLDQDCDMGCTGVDDTCSCTDDNDGDGHLVQSCGGDDCCDLGDEGGLGCSADTAGGINPSVLEVCGDGIDQDCDGEDPPCSCMDDADNDGHIALVCGGDDCCDDGGGTSLGCTDATAPGIHPGALDVCSNGVDEDCDGGEPICRSTATWPPTRDPVAVAQCPLPQAAPGGQPTVLAAVVGDEPVYVIAVFGDDELATTGNQGRADMEACLIDADTGHLACDTTWTVQNNTDTKQNFGADALLYFTYLYPFYGVNRETVATSPSTRTFHNSSIGRFAVNDPAAVTAGQLLGSRQSAAVAFEINRSYYQLLRLMSYVYAIGGWRGEYTDGAGETVPAGPTGTVERHQQ